MIVRRTLGILAAVALAAAGCDPGYEYKPIDGAGQRVEEWTTKIGDVQFTCGTSSLLIGSRSEFIHLNVENGSKDGVEIVGAQIETGGRTLAADLLPDAENRKARIVSPGETKSVTLLVDLGSDAADVLAPSIVDVWRVRIGSAEHVLRVELRRK